MAKILASRFRLGAGLATALAAGGTVAVCESDKRGPLFDPEALERGAKALKEINASPFAKKVFELTKQQEITKAQELKTEEAKHQAYQSQHATELERVRWEEQRKSMQQDAQTKAELSKYDDQLARARQADEHEKYRQRNAELVKMQEESSARQEQQRQIVAQQIEAERRATDQNKADLEKSVQREKALAEAEGRIKENRENEDINRRQMLARLEEERKKAIESIEATFRNLGEGMTNLLADKQKLTAAVGGLTVLALGIYTSKEGTRVAGRAIDRYLGTPKLVRETSRRGLFGRSKVSSGEKSNEAVKRDFSDIVLPEQMHNHIRALAAVTANTRAHGAPFRHMLFYGPPGTGKSMAAKRLARTAGMDYAIMSGGDVAPLGSGAVSQLHDMFDWAEGSRKGLLLFVDEADAFLGRRGDSMSEGLRGALNAMLFRTGDQSRDFAVVLATNRPADLDAAVIDRMDEAIEFPLPGPSERTQILKMYIDSYIAKAGTLEGAAGSGVSQKGWLRRLLTGQKTTTDVIRVDPGINDTLVQEAAAATEGFSGRELAKMVASMQAAVYGSPDAVLTPSMFKSVLSMKLHEHKQRAAFNEGQQTSIA